MEKLGENLFWLLCAVVVALLAVVILGGFWLSDWVERKMNRRK